MPSFAAKISLLSESYEHSKNSPAYRDLKIKYKELKAQNQELMKLIAKMFADVSVPCASVPCAPVPCAPVPCATTPRKISKSKKNKPKLRVSRSDNRLDDTVTDCVEIEEEVVAKLISEIEEAIVENEKKVAEDAVEEVVVEDAEEEVVVEETEEEVIEEEAEEEVVVAEEEAVVEEEVEEVVEEEVEEEAEEEVVEEEVVAEDDAIVAKDEEEEVVAEEEEEAGVYEIELDGVRYYTTNEQNGIVYELVGEDDVGDEIGKFVDGKLVIH